MKSASTCYLQSFLPQSILAAYTSVRTTSTYILSIVSVRMYILQSVCTTTVRTCTYNLYIQCIYIYSYSYLFLAIIAATTNLRSGIIKYTMTKILKNIAATTNLPGGVLLLQGGREGPVPMRGGPGLGGPGASVNYHQVQYHKNSL